MNEVNGALLLDKPTGMTSYDVIRKIKSFFPRKYKIGHAGTLDPFANGLLIILLGKGTKMMNDLLGQDKSYLFKAEFGYETDTQDVTGEVIEKDDTVIEKADLEKTVNKFVGEYDQTPPIYSAKKINGVPAYKLARQGKRADLKSKKVHINELTINEFEWPFASFYANVSSGTYIRTLTVDLAKSVGTLATTIELRRLNIGPFTVDSAIEIKELTEIRIRTELISVEEMHERIAKW